MRTNAPDTTTVVLKAAAMEERRKVAMAVLPHLETSLAAHPDLPQVNSRAAVALVAMEAVRSLEDTPVRRTSLGMKTAGRR